MSNDSLDERREAARQAMETPEHRAARETERARLTAKREEARRAMEDEKRRVARLVAEKAKQSLAEQQAAAAAEQAAKQRLVDERAQAAAAEVAAAAEQNAKRQNRAEETSSFIKRLLDIPAVEIEPIRTLKLDMESAVERKETSLASMALAEQKKRDGLAAAARAAVKAQTFSRPTAANSSFGASNRRSNQETAPLAPRIHPWKSWVVISLLIVLAAGAGFWLYQNRATWPNQTISLVNQLKAWWSGQTNSFDARNQTPIVPTDETLDINLQELDLTNLGLAIVNSAQAASSAAESLTGLNLIWNQLITPSFLNQRLNWEMTDNLLVALGPSLQLGWYRPATAAEPLAGFLILQSKQFERALAALRAWENELPAAMIATWFGETGPLPTPRFRAQLKNNFEIRVAEIGAGKKIVYGFINNELVVITATETAFAEIAERLLVPLAQN